MALRLWRLYTNPVLHDRVDRHQRKVIGIVADVPPRRVSVLARARSVPATSINVEHLEKIAEALHFDDRIFVGHTPPECADDDHAVEAK